MYEGNNKLLFSASEMLHHDGEIKYRMLKIGREEKGHSRQISDDETIAREGRRWIQSWNNRNYQSSEASIGWAIDRCGFSNSKLSTLVRNGDNLSFEYFMLCFGSRLRIKVII